MRFILNWNMNPKNIGNTVEVIEGKSIEDAAVKAGYTVKSLDLLDNYIEVKELTVSEKQEITEDINKLEEIEKIKMDREFNKIVDGFYAATEEIEGNEGAIYDHALILCHKKYCNKA